MRGALAVVLACIASAAQAAPVEAVVRDALARDLPAGLGIVAIHLPGAVRQLDVEPSTVAVIIPRELRAGRPSVKVSLPGKRTVWVPVSLAAAFTVAVARRPVASGATFTADDVSFEERTGAPGAVPDSVVGARATRAIGAGDVVGRDDVALPPPLARGAQVTIEIQRGAVRVKGAGVLERASRPGEPAAARIAATKQVVHGTLVAPSTVLVTGGELP